MAVQARAKRPTLLFALAAFALPQRDGGQSLLGRRRLAISPNVPLWGTRDAFQKIKAAIYAKSCQAGELGVNAVMTTALSAKQRSQTLPAWPRPSYKTGNLCILCIRSDAESDSWEKENIIRQDANDRMSHGTRLVTSNPTDIWSGDNHNGKTSKHWRGQTMNGTNKQSPTVAVHFKIRKKADHLWS